MDLNAYGRFALPIEIDPLGWQRIDKTVAIDLDVAGLLCNAGIKTERDLRLTRVIELDSAGQIVDDDVVGQFDPAGDESAPRGTLVLLMKGETAAFHRRRFRAYFDDAAAANDRITSRAADTDQEEVVRIWDCGEYEGQASYRIESPGATYVYHRLGGGFASLFDRDGNDWISYHPPGEMGPDYDPLAKGAGSANQFRGIPNTAFPKPGLHPGYEAATTQITASGPLKVSLRSETNDGEWACTWDIYPHYATFELHKHPRPYWFLYEGTPGGAFNADTGYILRSTGVRTPLSESWEEVLPDPAWVCFGDAKARHALYLVHHQSDEHVDSYWPMNDDMTVFGFGRAGRGKPTQSFMDKTPAQFTIGFTRSGAFEDVSRAINNAYRPLGIEVGSISAREG